MTVNGVPYEVDVKPNQTLVHLLREDLGLLGTKCGCEEGECGACTVIMNGRSVTSCLVPAVQADGADILTIEGLSEGEELHPIQEAYVEAGAIQCGFCTPGVVLSAKALLDENPDPDKEEICEALSGHLCRCTGYLQFYDALKIAAEKIAARKANKA
jgi:carbon-monoxide dehydrogenase small subunit